MRKIPYWIFLILFAGLISALVIPEPVFDDLDLEDSDAQRRKSASMRRAPMASEIESVKGRKRFSISYAQLPLRFEINQGQTDSRAKFFARGSGYSIFLTSNDVVLSFESVSPEPEISGFRSPLLNRGAPAPERSRPSSLSMQDLLPSSTTLLELKSKSPAENFKKSPASVLHLRLVDANPNPMISGLDELPGKSNYFFGKDPAKWRTNVPNFAKVRYQDVYPGVDLIYYGNHQKLEHDFVVLPGADPSRIQMAIEGADSLKLSGDGNLLAQNVSGHVIFRRPAVYQPRPSKTQNENQTPVEGRFVLIGENRVGFEIGEYDRARPLVIDPVLEYATYLGGSYYDQARAIAVDSLGYAYVAGVTGSPNFPVTPGAYQTTLDPYGSIFVAKLNPTGSALEYSTYLSGGEAYRPSVGNIAVNAAGEAFLVGVTFSDDVPTTPGAFQTVLAGDSDLYVAKLNSTGSALLYSTYLGGSSNEEWSIPDIALDASGNAYVTGSTLSRDFPTTSGAYDLTCGSDGNCNQDDQTWYADAFVAKINPTGTGLVYSTFLGGSGNDNWISYFYPSSAIVTEASGEVIVLGNTSSLDFPTTLGAYDATCGIRFACSSDTPDLFITKLNADGTALIFSTYLGGDESDLSAGLALDSAGNILVTGQTFANDFPTTPGAFKTECPFCPGLGFWQPRDRMWGEGIDGFVTKLNSLGSSLVYSTYLGLRGQEIAGIVPDSQGGAYLARNANLCTPIGLDWEDLKCPGNDIILIKVDSPDGSSLRTNNLGRAEFAVDVDSDPADNLYLAGSTTESEGRSIRSTPGAFQASPGGQRDGFVAKIKTSWPDPLANIFPSSLGFGDLPLNNVSELLQIRLANDGDTAMEIARATTDSDFQIATSSTCPSSGSLSPWDDCLIGVTFAPTALGARAGNLTIATNAPGSPHLIPLSGRGVNGSQAAISPTELKFSGHTPVQTTSQPEKITLRNDGDYKLIFEDTNYDGDFVVTMGSCPMLYGFFISPGESCEVMVQFAPAAAGTRTGSWTLTTNAPGSPHVVALSGVGTDFSLSSSPPSQTIKAGETATYTLNVNPFSGFDEPVSLNCEGAPLLASCQVSTSSVTPDGTNPAAVTLTVTTTAGTSAFTGSRPLAPPGPPNEVRPGTLPLLALLVTGILASLAVTPRRRVPVALATALLAILLWGSCGGGSTTPPPRQRQWGTPAGTYTLTVTGTLGFVGRATNVTLKVI